ncbi:MAG TPA: LacI family DNA-binding transcriptional regulator [Solirubrobacterales bacterium]|nr:LacI family DNA-binding transcriptional regulator [Solirubrobacterales bacterium]
MARRPTLSDVARRAGVNPATASRALNPALPGRIAEPTAERVRAAARELGYRPDPVARSLRTRRSGFVGVVVPDLTNPVIPPIVRGIEAVLWGAGLACLLADTDNDPEHEAALIDELLARRCEGLIVSTATRWSEAVNRLADAEVPAVLVTRDTDAHPLPLVAGDDASGVEAAVSHLAELGHKRLAHVTGPTNLSTTVRRLEAFEAACERLGLDADGRVIHGDAFTASSGRAAAERLLAADSSFTGIVAGNDLIALGCLQALGAAGLRCPHDVSLVGHNDTPMVDSLQPPLTTVAIPQRDLGARAAELVLRGIDGDEIALEAQLLPTELVVRGSTGPARARA